MKFIALVVAALLGEAYGYGPQASGSAPVPSTQYSGPDLQGSASNFNRAVSSGDPISALAATIPGGGVPGQDYPLFASVPDTGFSCISQQTPGYYADTNAGCQAFHICEFDGRQNSFLCPNGTIFNQQYFVCDWWYNVDCSASQQFVSLNVDIGKASSGGNLLGSASSNSASFGGQQPSRLYGAPQ